MTVFGYIKKGYLETIEAQIEKLEKYNCAFFFIESDTENQRTKESQMMAELRKNDTVVAVDFRVFKKSLKEFHDFFKRLATKDVQLIVVNDRFDSCQPLLFHDSLEIMLMMDNCQKRLPSTPRVIDPRLASKPHGRPSIEQQKIDEINMLYYSKKLSMRSIALECDVSLGTVHKYLTSKEESIIP